jgi:hypothetical protein
LVFN